jgi:hypothetical protein
MFSTNVSIILMELVYLRKWTKHPHHGLFTNIPHIIGFSNHTHSRLFTNKFLHVSINNKIISINRKEAYIVSNSSTKATKQQNKVINNKISWTLSKTTTYLC